MIIKKNFKNSAAFKFLNLPLLLLILSSSTLKSNSKFLGTFLIQVIFRGHDVPVLYLPIFNSQWIHTFTDSYLVFSLISFPLFLFLIQSCSHSTSLRSKCHLKVKSDKTTDVDPLKDMCIQTGIKILNWRGKSNCNSTKRWNSTT